MSKTVGLNVGIGFCWILCKWFGLERLEGGRELVV